MSAGKSREGMSAGKSREGMSAGKSREGDASELVTNGLSTRRRFVDVTMRVLLCMSGLVALVPLVAVLAFTIAKGAGAVTPEFLTHSMRGVGPLDSNGGAYHAIVGTLEQVAIAFVLAVPIGLAVAVYLVEVGRGRLASSVRFLVDVMTGIPSIVAGLFVFSFWVLGLGLGFSGLSAGLALAVLMLPVVVRSAEEILKLVPNELREASYALGATRWRTTWSVVLPSAASGITTGVILALARVTGETAPLLLTAFGYDAIRNSPVDGPQSALPLFVFSQASSAFDVAITRAWAGALTLIAIVMLMMIVAQLISKRTRIPSS